MQDNIETVWEILMTMPDAMRHILILRHAKSDWATAGMSDFDRPLAARGRHAAAAMGAFSADTCPVPDVVLCSAARRAVETWQIVARQWPDAPSAVFSEELYNVATGDLLQRLRQQSDATTVMLVGHHPGFDGLAISLAADQQADPVNRMRVKFPTAGLAHLTFTGPWSDLGPEMADLVRFVRPKDLV